MEKYLSWYKEIIAKNGIKYTKQKELILIELIHTSSHLTAEEIYKKVKDNKIGLATVYRSLNLFERLGIVKEIPMNGINYYELKLFGRKPLHIHFKCMNCNCMIDIDDTDINLDYIRLNQKVEQKMGLEVKDANITLLGLCNECRKNQNVY